MPSFPLVSYLWISDDVSDSPNRFLNSRLFFFPLEQLLDGE